MIGDVGRILAIVSVSVAIPALAQQEPPAADIAAQVRLQGHPCDGAVSARKDIKYSWPDEPLWILNCTNATAAEAPFAALIEWMQQNLDQPLDVPALAARAGLAERSFYRKFTRATGKTPAHFVESLRLEAARTLLAKGLPLKTIAGSVGLTSSARLGQAFERRFGMAPSLFREMHRVNMDQHLESKQGVAAFRGSIF